MRITRDPHDPDFQFDFHNFEVRLNGIPAEINDLIWADEETGAVAYFHWDGEGVPIADPDTDPVQPVGNVSRGKVEIIFPTQREGCSGCDMKALQRKAKWFI